MELVGDGADDRDPEAALDELVLVEAREGRLGVEPVAVVGDLDDELVRMQLVEQLDRPVAAFVRVPDGVGARLGERELEIGERFALERRLEPARAR